MDGAILAIIVLGSALVVVVIYWVLFFKPAAKSDEPYGPFIGREGLEKLYIQEYDQSGSLSGQFGLHRTAG
jgi:hypothetical protein